MIKFISFFFLFGIIQGAKGQNGTRAFMNDSLDGYVEKALTDWKIPGVAFCVVKDGKVVMMKSYGVAEWGSQNKIDEHTLFGIGSNTKAFTATALALLDAQKKISLDDKVQKWLPDFKLYDPWVAKRNHHPRPALPQGGNGNISGGLYVLRFRSYQRRSKK